MSSIPHTLSSDAEVALFIFERVIPPKIKGKIAKQPPIIPKIINIFAVFLICMGYYLLEDIEQILEKMFGPIKGTGKTG